MTEAEKRVLCVSAQNLAERWIPGTRKNSTRPAWTHPQDVAKVIQHMRESTPTGRSWSVYEFTQHRDVALLHDVLEDGIIDGRRVRIQDLLNAGVLYGVVTSVVALTKRDDEDKPTYLERLKKESTMVRTVKLADRCCNLKEAAETGGFGPKWLAKYKKQTIDYVAPLARTLPYDICSFLEAELNKYV